MNELTLQRVLTRRTRELSAWQAGAIGLLVLASLYSAATTAALMDVRERLGVQTVQLQQAKTQLLEAEDSRDHTLEQLETAVRESEREKLARQEQAEAYEAIGAYQYMGICTITAYCPCEECCGRWADGLTATGVPAEPGIVAVDPEIIPLGSTVIVDGQQYLAADTGVTGQWIDICVASHREAEAFGVQTAAVWIIPQESGDAP